MVENHKILLIPVIARRFLPKQSHLAEGIASLRFIPLAMTKSDYWFLEWTHS